MLCQLSYASVRMKRLKGTGRPKQKYSIFGAQNMLTLSLSLEGKGKAAAN